MERRVAISFVGGMALPLVGVFLVVPVLGNIGAFTGGSVFRPLVVMLAMAIVGGALASGALRRGWRGRLAFAAAFPLGVCVPLLVVMSLQTLSGHESLLQLLLAFVASFALSFGLLGTVGTALLGIGGAVTRRVGVAFTGAGAVGGLVLVAMVTLLPAATNGGTTLMLLLGSGIAFLVPSTLGGWWLGRQIGLAERKHDTVA